MEDFSGHSPEILWPKGIVSDPTLFRLECLRNDQDHLPHDVPNIGHTFAI